MHFEIKNFVLYEGRVDCCIFFYTVVWPFIASSAPLILYFLFLHLVCLSRLHTQARAHAMCLVCTCNERRNLSRSLILSLLSFPSLSSPSPFLFLPFPSLSLGQCTLRSACTRKLLARPRSDGSENGRYRRTE